eukprot:2965792-Rhodomonas_salina.2
MHTVMCAGGSGTASRYGSAAVRVSRCGAPTLSLGVLRCVRQPGDRAQPQESTSATTGTDSEASCP